MKYIYTLCILFCANLLYSQEDTMRLDGDFTIPPPKDIDSTIYMMEPFKITVVKNNKVHDEYHFLVLSELYGKVDTVWSRELTFNPRSIEQIKIFEKTKMVIIAFGGGWSFRSVFLEWDGTKWNRIMSDIMARRFPGDPPVSFDVINYNKIICVENNIKTLIEYDLEKKTEKRTAIKE